MRRGAARKAAMLAAEPLWPSPCVGICEMDGDTCQGCGRSTAEIAGWRDGEDAFHEQAWRTLPQRQIQLGIALRPIPWSTGDLLNFMSESLSQNLGTWVIGVPGAIGEFFVPAGDYPEVQRTADAVTARFAGSRLQLQTPEKSRAFAVASGPEPSHVAGLAIGLPGGRLRIPVAQCVTEVASQEVSGEGLSGARIFDLGLGHRSARFMIAVTDDKLAERVGAFAGRHLTPLMAETGEELIAASPMRILESMAGVMQVTGPIPHHYSETPLGPHTHLLPDVLASGRETPASFTLPKVYAPMAQFFFHEPIGHDLLWGYAGSAGLNRRD